MDFALHVWLETLHKSGEVQIVPYVKTTQGQELLYRISLEKNAAAGRSRIKQEGSVTVQTNRATALTHLTLGPAAEISACKLDIGIEDASGKARSFKFDCMPRPD